MSDVTKMYIREVAVGMTIFRLPDPDGVLYRTGRLCHVQSRDQQEAWLFISHGRQPPIPAFQGRTVYRRGQEMVRHFSAVFFWLVGDVHPILDRSLDRFWSLSDGTAPKPSNTLIGHYLREVEPGSKAPPWCDMPGECDRG